MKLDITVGFNLPSKKILEEINYYIYNNIINQYRQLEEDFKNKYFEEAEEFEEGKKQYENDLELLNNYTHENLFKNDTTKGIKNFAMGEKNKFCNLLLEDYLLYFINNNFKGQNMQLMISIKEFMKIILNNKFNSNKNNLDIENIALKLNWIESYSIEIISMIRFYIFLYSFENNNNLNEKIKKNISDLNNEYKIINISTNIKIINTIFYITIGSLIRILISELNTILSKIKEQNDLNILVDDLNSIYYSLLSINNNLNLSCKEIYLLHETIKIISILSLNDNEQDIEKNKKLVIDFIQKKIINKEKYEHKNQIQGPRLKANNGEEEEEDTEEEKDLKNCLNNFYNYYKSNNKINFTTLFSSVLLDEFNKEYNEKYRKYILKIILEDDDLVQNNILIIKIILAEYIKPEKEIMDEALDYISGEETYFPILNNYNNEIVENTIIKIFDSIINLYLDSFEKLEDHIISDLLFIYKEYIRVIEEKSYDKYYNNYCNENLVKLYVICFIKIYLNRFSNFIINKKNSLQFKENEIIEEINKDTAISNSIKLYFIILIYKKSNNSLNLLNVELLKALEEYSNNLKEEIGQNNLYDILNKSLIPKEEKYLFNEYFNYINYPSLVDFNSKFNSSNDNKEKYPLLNIYIQNESNHKKLKDLHDYKDFLNFMINYYSGNISRNEASKEKRSLNLEPIFDQDEFKKKFQKFKDIWNTYLSNSLKDDDNNLSDEFPHTFEGNERLAYFLNDNDDNGYGIFVLRGLQKYIKWQNSFLTPIINAYKTKKNNILSCYISQIEKSVNVQDANNLQILQIEKCFQNTYFINFNELLSFYCNRKKDNLNDLEYNFEKIEEELGKSLLPNKCLFNEKNIKYICYQNEGFRYINYDFLIKFGKKYGEKELSEEERKTIFIYSNKEYYNFDTLYDSFILLVNYLNNQYYEKKDSKIIDFINKAKKKYINFSEQFISFFKKDGKDISIEKLLNSILYMEHLCYEHLIEKIDINFKVDLDRGQKEEITNYFKSKHKDGVITKKEISCAVRRFITRYLLNDSRKENIDPNSELYTALERKYLWKNEIFGKVGKNFNDLIKQYLGKFNFPLEVKHSYVFYKLIGDEEKQFLEEEKEKYDGKDKVTKEGNNLIKTQNPQNQVANVLSMSRASGKKPIIKGKMKTKNENKKI